jgi:hypothetical protein
MDWARTAFLSSESGGSREICGIARSQRAGRDIVDMSLTDASQISQVGTRFLSASEKALRDAGGASLSNDRACEREESDETSSEHIV